MHALLELLYTLLYVAYSFCEAAFRLVVDSTPKSVRNKVALITGGARGIGRETAFLLANKGARIVLWDIDEKTVQSTADDLKAAGAEVYFYKCDVSSYDDVTKVAAQVQRDVGDVDILINNAGFGHCKHITELSEEEITRTMAVNTLAHFWTLKAFLPAMMAQNQGHVVTISSYAGLAGSQLLTDYTASKFAVRGLTDALERELRHKSLRDVKMTTVYPLFTNTALLWNASAHAKANMRFGKIMEPEEVASAIVEGLLRNKREVYIPRRGILLPFVTGAFPWKAQHVLADFMDERFVCVND